ncbi:histidine kinase [Chitinophaga horti]|uniref:histidine kinase n=1 Tax=Chitinophaga horti TaxID=2920382 RepID=A0ABY6IYY3_9BACT|nr:sensor histidine kinase [Chitinophaga horti]UYQ92386.1 histidine kinase [Chitinophaga horti]
MLCFTAGKAQQSYVYTHYTVEDGLRNNQVISLLSDSRGYMWLGTANGLQRYDGVSFRFVDMPFSNPSIARETVQCMYEDKSRKTLWFVLHSGVVAFDYGANKYHYYKIQHGHREGSVQISSIQRDKHGYLWTVSTQDNAYIFDEKKQAFVLYTRFLPEAPGKIVCVLEDGDDYLFGTTTGICRLDYKKRTYYHKEHNPNSLPYLDVPQFNQAVNNMYLTRQGILFVNIWPYGSAAPFLYTFDTRRNQLHEFTDFNVGGLRKTFEDSYGKTWVAGDRICLFDSTGQLQEEIVQDRSTRFGLDCSQLYAITPDNMHNIWLGTNNGVFIFNKEKQKFHTAHFPPIDNFVRPNFEPTDILQTSPDKVYVSSWGQGLLVYDSTLTHLIKAYRHPNDAFFNLGWNLLRDREGNIWMAAQHGRYAILNPKTGSIKYERSDTFDNRTIRCMTMDTAGNIWMGTQRGLVVKWDVKQRQFTRYQDSLYHTNQPLWGHIMDLEADHLGNIYIGTGAYGLLQMDAATGRIKKRYGKDEPENRLPGNGIHNIQVMGDTLVLGTMEGIALINTRTGHITTFTEKDGLPVNMITNVQLINRNLFFTTNFNLGKINLDNRKLVNYGRKYGIVEEAFEQTANHRLMNGRIVVGSVKSLISFDPDQLEDPQPPPDVRITSLQLGERLLNADSILLESDLLRLSYKEGPLTIGYNAMAYLDQDNITYYYQLEGVDPQPVVAGTRVLVNYANLPSGRHTFKVWCENGEGLASAHVTTFMLQVASPYYRQWWFFMLILMLIAGLAYLGYRIRINRLIATEQVRRRIARDLHDDMGSTLTSINIMTTMAKRNVRQDNQKTEDFLLKIGESTTRMMESMDDIVWSINPNNDNMPIILARMREFTTSMFEAREIGFTFHADEAVQHLKLTLESRHDFFMIFKEAINNIAKHAQATHVDIIIDYKKKTLIMQVKDNGHGFKPGSNSDGDGLFNMQRRAQRMRGSLEIASAPGSGTRICLRFPTT